jgi:NAD(P)-dependent dehydrogenase (short-subunit alcohol dehydrogenase family)
MNPAYDFRGHVALVTGASSGIGLTTAQAFAQAGAAVVLADVNETALREVTDDLTAAGHRVLGVTCDVSDEEQVAAMVQAAVAQFGRLDMAFNNAGIMAPPTDAAEETAEQFDRIERVWSDAPAVLGQLQVPAGRDSRALGFARELREEEPT